MYDEQHFSRDATVFLPDESADGITIDDDGQAEFDWNDVEKVTVDDVPLAEAFETDEFYKIPGTVARPIPQPYSFGEDEITLMKPREELKKGAWSLDNKPWTLGHPETGMVKSIDHVRGFWRNPRYIDSLDDLKADLHVPVGDDEAREFIEDNGDVSVGFYHRIERVDQYDGVVGGEDSPDGIDGYQTHIYFDHVASVSVGRCPSGAGCGIHGNTDHGHVEPFISGTATTNKSRGADSMSQDFQRGESHGVTWTTDYRDDEDRYFAVAPDENPDDEPKFPIANCSDVSDAWKLRKHGDINISVEQLESRIKRRANELGCETPGDEESEDSLDALKTALDRYEINPLKQDNTSMTEQSTDCTDCGGQDNIEFDLDDMTVEFVAEQHDGVAEKLEELEAATDKAEAYDDVVEALDLDDGADPAEAVKSLKDDLDAATERLDEIDAEEKESLIEEITAHTDKWEADELEDEDLETVRDKHELVMELTADERTANSGGSADDIAGPQRQTPWD